jgi:hypothetical protein
MANIEKIDPRQAKALSLYKDPSSNSFGNLQESMIQAGYSPNSTRSVYTTTPAWLSENIKQDVDMIKQAESNLRKYNSIKIDILGDHKNAIDIARLLVDVSKFIVKTLAKQKYSDMEDKTPPAVQINIVNYHDTKPQEATDAVIVDNMTT